ncbi:MAG: phospholipase D-like domain-containing protein [Myxococcota bacterium]
MNIKIKVLPEARAQLQPLQDLQDPETNKVLDEAVKEAVRVDGDRVLDRFEAEAIRSAFQAVAPQGGPLSSAQAGEVRSAISVRLGELKSARVNATEVIFTSEGQALEKFRAKIVGSMQEVIQKANGRKVDINMMVFAFTDKVMADAIVQMAKQNPNVNFRLLTDWGQMASSGDRQPSRLAKLAEREGITNLHIKFKKDNPYTWDSHLGRPMYSHTGTQGLNHHKGFVALIDGEPQKMTMGSFNWSQGGMESNYENLMLLDRADPDNRPIMDGYQKEFEGFWNNDEAALNLGEAEREKERIYKALHEANGRPYTPRTITSVDPADPQYASQPNGKRVDINSFSDADTQRLSSVVGESITRDIQKELREYGRFDSWTELLTRVPKLAAAETWMREQLMGSLEYGEGGLSVNTANEQELRRAGLSSNRAKALVEFRSTHGAFESLEELDAVRGIAKGTIEKLREVATDDENMGLYSARVPGQAATTGYAEVNRGKVNVPTAGRSEAHESLPTTNVPTNRVTQEEVDRTLAAPVMDLLRRAAPGQTFRMAMYGMSTSSPEFQELKRAAERGVKIRVVIFKDYNEGAISTLKAMKTQGLEVDTRVISNRVMHQKFGVCGDDVFNGSANWSSSSITKHSEDRFYFRNMPDLSQRFVEEFARLWERGNEPR